MAVVTIRQLLDSGVHFGHQTRRWNPKMRRFILTDRSGIYIIDLQQSLAFIDKAYDFVKETVAHGGSILFVGTKRQAQEAIAEQALRVGQPYINQRWLGGLAADPGQFLEFLARAWHLAAVLVEQDLAGCQQMPGLAVVQADGPDLLLQAFEAEVQHLLRRVGDGEQSARGLVDADIGGLGR